MKFSPQNALDWAAAAARSAGALMRREQSAHKKINSQSQFDIKLELDVRCQRLIGKALSRAFPQAALLGEEGVAGEAQAPWRWVVDPIDGTVNFSYGVPHACVSIALQRRGDGNQYATEIGVVYDPFCQELWTAARGQAARLNGRIIRVSRRRKLAESIVAFGFSKSRESLRENLPVFNALIGRVRKIRMMGAAALSLTYVASGRFDAYIESGISLWDIAAGGLILERAGGEFWHRPLPAAGRYRMIASNGLLRAKLLRIVRAARKLGPGRTAA
jgi:myo-inositol-1(or 4)-monophosphatase